MTKDVFDLTIAELGPTLCDLLGVPYTEEVARYWDTHEGRAAIAAFRPHLQQLGARALLAANGAPSFPRAAQPRVSPVTVAPGETVTIEPLQLSTRDILLGEASALARQDANPATGEASIASHDAPPSVSPSTEPGDNGRASGPIAPGPRLAPLLRSLRSLPPLPPDTATGAQS